MIGIRDSQGESSLNPGATTHARVPPNRDPNVRSFLSSTFAEAELHLAIGRRKTNMKRPGPHDRLVLAHTRQLRHFGFELPREFSLRSDLAESAGPAHGTTAFHVERGGRDVAFN